MSSGALPSKSFLMLGASTLTLGSASGTFLSLAKASADKDATRRRMSAFGRRPCSTSGRALAGVVALIGATTVAAAQQAAQPATAQVEDVLVGSPKETGELSARKLQVLELPRPIVVVDPKAAVRERLERLTDFAEKVPNYRVEGGHPRRAATIRGVGLGAGSGDGAESDTGFIVDNVFWKNFGFQWGDFVDLESFELALGPQGTAYGKNTTVGNAIIRTQLPSFTRKATFETSFANNARFIEKLNVTGPIVDDKLAYRVTFYVDKDNGWIKDQVTGAGLRNSDRWGVRGQLLFVGDAVTDRLIFNYGRSNEYSNTGSCASSQCSSSNSFQVFANGTRPARTYSETFQQRLGRPVLTFDPYKPLLTSTPTFHQHQYTTSNELNLQIGENTLTSVSAYGHFRLLPRTPLGNELAEISGSRVESYVDQFSQEVRFASPTDQKLEWVTGVYSLYENVWNHNILEFGTDSARWFSRPALLKGMRSLREGKARTFDIAAFAQTTYHVDEQLALTFGFRDNYEIKEGSHLSWATLHQNQYTAAEQLEALRAGGAQQIFDTGGVTKYFNSITGIFNPKYRYDEHLLFYGLVGRGEKAGAVNTGAQPIVDSRGALKGWQPVVTKPEVSWDYEIGVKTNWLDGKLIANFNLYWNDLYQFQTNLTDASNIDSFGQPIRTTYLGNADHARLRGFEFDGRWSPAERLWINYSGAYTDARWVDFRDAPTPADWNWSTPTNPPAGFVRAPAALSRSNTRWEGVPMWSFNIGGNYEHPLGALFRDLGDWGNTPVTGFGYFNVAWQDKIRLTDPASVFQYWLSPVARVNLGFGLRSDDERYTLTFWTKNLLDKRPITAWSPGNISTSATIGWTNDWRTFGGTLLVKLD